MKKGQILEGIVKETEFPNKGIIEIEGKKAVVKNTIEGQKVKFVVSKKRSDKIEGRLLEVLEKSEIEDRQPLCKYFGVCGGCTYQNLSYENQLKLKETQVKKLLDKVIDNYKWDEILGSPNEFEYRNKMEFTFGDEVKGGELALGMHKKNSFHDIITVDGCKIVNEDYSKIIMFSLDYFKKSGNTFYKKLAHIGCLRNLVIRRTAKKGDILVNLVTTTAETINTKDYVNGLLKLDLNGKIVGIIHTLNDTLGDVVQSDEMKLLYGENYIYEEILGLKFKISPFSFFQTNSLGAEVLYEKVRKYVGETKDKIIFDLYSGTGTIAQMLSKVAKKVIGVEIVEEAVQSAKINAKLNEIENCEFIAGDVLKVIDNIKEKPDIIVLDPPRDGINKKALEKIINYGVNEIVYISCKPTSLVRDLEIFKEKGYKVIKAGCVDMFPETVHVETVCLLTKKA